MRHILLQLTTGLVICLTGCRHLPVDPGAAEQHLSKGLLFHASFDDGLAPEFSQGAATFSGAWATVHGKHGQAWHNAGGGASYLTAANLDTQRGTLAFWLQTDADMAALEPAPTVRRLFAYSNFAFNVYLDRQVAFFMTGCALPGQDFKWDYSLTVPLTRFPAGRWIHIALTWDASSGEKAIFLDGQLVASTTTNLFPHLDSGRFSLGQDLPGSYDELAIWGRVLSPAEIATLAADSSALLATPASRLSTAEHVETDWPLYPDLVMTNGLDALVDQGADWAVSIPLLNRTGRACTAAVTLTLLDLAEQPVGQPQVQSVTLAAGQRSELPVRFTLTRLGSYKIRATVEASGKSRTRDVASCGCIPPGIPPRNTLLGAHVNMAGQLPEMARRLGFTANRSHNMTQFTWWTRMQPEPGEWAMSTADAYTRLRDLGFSNLGQWFAAPYWAVTQADGQHPAVAEGYPKGWRPTDTDALRTYVRESLTRFPDIDQWEIWNEPYVSMFWNGTPEQYADLCKTIYTEAKRVRPEITVYAMINSEGPWTEAALAAGVLDACDGIAYHWYNRASQPPEAARAEVTQLRALLARHTDRDLPLINSESGTTGTTFLRGLDFPDLVPEAKRPPLDAATAAARLVQFDVIQMAAGIGTIYYYFHQPVPASKQSGMWKYQNYSTLEVTNAPKPAAVALNILAWELGGGTFQSELLLLGDDLRAYLIERPDGSAIAIAWAEHGGVAEGHWPGSAKELMGNPCPTTPLVLGDAPVYLEGASLSALKAQLASTTWSWRDTPTANADGPGDGEAAAPQASVAFPLASELQADHFIPVPLGNAAIMGLTDDRAGDGQGGCLDEGPYNDLRDLQPGPRSWLGIPFAIAPPPQSMITMRGRTFGTGPLISQPIPVGRKVRALYFAHLANWASKPGITVGSYLIRYTDGTSETIPLVTGGTINDWWMDRQPGEASRTWPLRHSKPLEPKHPWRFVRVLQWDNPHNDRTIADIVVRSAGNNATLGVLAITAAVWR